MICKLGSSCSCFLAVNFSSLAFIYFLSDYIYSYFYSRSMLNLSFYCFKAYCSPILTCTTCYIWVYSCCWMNYSAWTNIWLFSYFLCLMNFSQQFYFNSAIYYFLYKYIFTLSAWKQQSYHLHPSLPFSNCLHLSLFPFELCWERWTYLIYQKYCYACWLCRT